MAAVIEVRKDPLRLVWEVRNTLRPDEWVAIAEEDLDTMAYASLEIKRFLAFQAATWLR